MNKRPGTRAQLLEEVSALRQRVAQLEAAASLQNEADESERDRIYRKLFDASTDAIFIETLAGEILDCNETACQMYGYSRQEMLRLAVANLVPHAVAESLPEIIRQEQLRGGIFVLCDNVRKNGEVFPVEVSTRMLREEGEPGVVTYVRDLTKQVQAAQSLEQRMQEMIAIYETSLEISAQRDLVKLLPAIVERAVSLTGAQMGGLYLIQPDGQTIKLVVSHHLPQDYTGVTLRLGEGLSGLIAQTGLTMIIDDYQSWMGRAQVFSESPFRTVLGVPLKIEDRVIGVINITDTQPREHYSEQQIRLITLFANQAALAIHNAQLLEALQTELAVRQRTEKVQAALYRISEATQTAEDLHGLFELLHVIIAELMPARNFYIALYDVAADLISYPYYADQFDAPPPTAKPMHGLTEYVLHQGQPLLATPELYLELQADGHVDAIGSPPVDWLGVPLKIQKDQIGMMAVQSYNPHERYTQADQDVLAFVSSQAAMAIERKRSGDALRHSAERYQLLFQKAPVGILLIDPQGNILEVNPTALRLLGSPSAEATKEINIFTYEPIVEVGFAADVQKCLETGHALIAEIQYISKWGKPVQLQYFLSPILKADRQITLIQAMLVDITERKHSEQEIRRLNLDLRDHANELSLLNQAGQVMASTLNLQQLYQLVADQSCRLINAEVVILMLTEPTSSEIGDSACSSGESMLAASAGLACEQAASIAGLSLPLVNSLAGQVVKEKRSILIPDSSLAEGLLKQLESLSSSPLRSVLAVPLTVRGKLLGVVQAINKLSAPFDEHDQELLEALCGSAAIALENARLLAETQRRAEQLSLLYDAGIALNHTLDSHLQLQALSQIAMQALHADNSGFFRYDPSRNEIYFEFGIGPGADQAEFRRLRTHVGQEQGLIGWIAQQRLPYYLPDVRLDPRWIAIDPKVLSVYWVPIEHESRLLGLLSVSSYRLDAFSADDQRLLVLFANQVAVALDNARLYQSAVSAGERRTTLHWLSQEINSSSLEPERIYSAIYQAAQKLMPAEAFTIALQDESIETINLVFCIDRGQRYPAPSLSRGEGLSGHVIQSGRSLIIADVLQKDVEIDLVHYGSKDSVRSILAVPMRLGERVLGMLSAQSYQPGAYSADDANLLEILAASAAIALDNADIFYQMQAANEELAKAYEATIEGWSRALEMRDKETKGHSDRVTRIALRVAQEMGFTAEMLVHMRRGVLLHDIGKMAVPDHILLKPSSLSDDEWQVMRQHPFFAYKMLSGIPFLEPALDIPYCHHENWDGSGYPQGLKGTAIPLGARIFSLVDVWDALSSDRPYRMAWTPSAVRAYIQQQSGIRFDPNIIPVFLKLLDEGKFQNER